MADSLATNGLDLKLRRVAADLKGYEVAQEMGISPSRLSAIEGSRNVTSEMSARYLQAVATLSNVSPAAEAV